MIFLKSDYSPQVAGEKQEAENILMVYTGLHIAGMSQHTLEKYKQFSQEAADAYNEALGEPETEVEGSEYPVHSKEQWEAASEATKEPLRKAGALIVGAGITVDNVLKKSENEGYFSHINTTIYSGEADMVPVCCIERAITDEEAETYQDNKMGWGALTCLNQKS